MDKEVIKIDVDNKQINKMFEYIAKNVKDPKKILRRFGKKIKDDVEWSFENEQEFLGDKWQDWSDAYYERVRKNIGGNILQLEGDLRKSISRKIKDNSLIVGTNKEYAAIHNFGFDGKNKKGVEMNMPQRTYLPFSDEYFDDLASSFWAILKLEATDSGNKEMLNFLDKL